MRKTFCLVWLLFIIASIVAAPAAMAYNHIITVYAAVPEQRAVYLDPTGAIIKVAGNTADNVTPIVFDPNNKAVAMTPEVQRQYDDFLKLNNGRLQAGKIYNINPITVSAAPNAQLIEINSVNLSLSSLKVD